MRWLLGHDGLRANGYSFVADSEIARCSTPIRRFLGLACCGTSPAVAVRKAHLCETISSLSAAPSARTYPVHESFSDNLSHVLIRPD